MGSEVTHEMQLRASWASALDHRDIPCDEVAACLRCSYEEDRDENDCESHVRHGGEATAAVIIGHVRTSARWKVLENFLHRLLHGLRHLLRHGRFVDGDQTLSPPAPHYSLIARIDHLQHQIAGSEWGCAQRVDDLEWPWLLLGTRIVWLAAHERTDAVIDPEVRGAHDLLPIEPCHEFFEQCVFEHGVEARVDGGVITAVAHVLRQPVEAAQRLERIAFVIVGIDAGGCTGYLRQEQTCQQDAGYCSHDHLHSPGWLS